MMEFLSKVFDKIASIKGGIILILSFVFGILGAVLFPNAFKAFHQKLPFENTYNIAIGFVFLVCCFYLLFYFVSFGLPGLINKFRSALVFHIQNKIDYDAEIDSLMCFFDAVSDSDHDIVVSLLNNHNKIPYTCNRYSRNFDSHSPFYFYVKYKCSMFIPFVRRMGITIPFSIPIP